MVLFRSPAFLRESAVLIALVLAFLVLSAVCQYYSASLPVHLEITAQHPDNVTIFWRGSDYPYAIERSWTGPIGGSHPTTIDTTLPLAVHIDFIRIDPGNRPGRVTIKTARLSAGDDHTIDLVDDLRETPATRINQLDMELRPDEIALEATGNDPFFEVRVPFGTHVILHLDRLIPILLFSCLLISLLVNQRFLRGPKNCGTLKVSLPGGNILRLPDGGAQLFRFHGRVFRHAGDQVTTYGVDVFNIEPLSVAALLDAVKRLNATADVRFHYRRSGEV